MKVTAQKRFIIDLSKREANNLIWVLDELKGAAAHKNGRDLISLDDIHNELINKLIENIENASAK